MAIGSYAGNDGTGYAYLENGVSADSLNTIETNRTFPTGTTTTVINFTTPPSGAGTPAIKVPMLLRTAIQAGEGYSFFYNYVPYQGLWDHTGSAVSGSIEAVGPAITTTAGSGGISNYKIINQDVIFDGSEFIYGVGTQWLSTVRPGYIVKYLKNFKIKNVISDILIEAETITGVVDPGVTVSIEAFDLPKYGYPNIIDRFPALHISNDHNGNGELLSFDSLTKNPTLETKILSRTQDIMDVPVSDVQIGKNDAADRGRNMVYLSSGLYGTGALGLQYESVKLDVATINHYKKTYQSYVMNNEGRLYMMVVGSETDNVLPGATTDGTCLFNTFSSDDVVDLFEIPGRPIITG
jgi:hypothetical protein